MRENGNPAAPQMDASLRDLITRAHEDERYEWRTVDGLSQQIGTPEAKVQEVLAGLEQEVCVLLFPMIRAVLCTQPAITTSRLTE